LSKAYKDSQELRGSESGQNPKYFFDCRGPIKQHKDRYILGKVEEDIKGWQKPERRDWKA
jgi:hypothetical protein